MASSIRKWTVVILSEDEEFEMNCRKNPNSTLAEVMQTWRDECKIFGNWHFVSPDDETEYTDDQITIQDIGESAPNSRVVSLKVIPSPTLSQNRYIDIFVSTGGKCHQVMVKPNYRLYKVLSRFAVGGRCFEYQGKALNLKQTVQEAGLQQKSLVYESSIRVCVKLSNGIEKSFRVPLEALVKQLQTEVAAYEDGDFSLTYCGKVLQANELVKDLKRSVEVSRVSFIVNIEGRRISWKTGSGKIKFQDFVDQLYDRSQIDRARLENTQFECSGCGRRICKIEEDHQLVEIDCCRQKSLTLTAKLPTNSQGVNTTSDTAERTRLKDPASDQPQTKQSQPAFSQPHSIGIQVETKSQPAFSQPHSIGIQVETILVRLLVFFWSNEFSPNVDMNGFETEDEYPWSQPFIKCSVNLRSSDDDWIGFEEIRYLLNSFFTPKDPSDRIERISQRRAEVDLDEVAWVTSDNDEVEEQWRNRVFSDTDGTLFSRNEVEKLERVCIEEGDRVLIIPRRRTVLTIYND